MSKRFFMKRKKAQQVGILWKLVLYFAIFITALLVTLWLFQIVFLGDIYRNIKRNETFHAAEALKSTMTSTIYQTKWKTKAIELAESNHICVAVLDDNCRTLFRALSGICYVGYYNRECFVHSTDSSFLSELSRIRFLQTIRQSKSVYFQNVTQDSTTQSYTPYTYQEAHQEGISSTLYIEHMTINNVGYYIVIHSDIVPINSTVQTLQFEIVIIGCIFIVAAIIMAFILSRKISFPIIKINSAAKQLAQGDYATTFEGEGYREISELRDTLNYAAAELSKVEGFRRELIANVSHDLRTPLTMITGYAEVMRDLPDENTPDNVQVIIDEGNRLTSLVNDLLDLSKLQTGAVTLKQETFSLTDCLNSINLRYQKLKENDGYKIHFECHDDVYVYADRPKIEQVIYNLVNNAITYTGEDKVVCIRQTLHPSQSGQMDHIVRISIIDTGPGISEENLPYIWDRYYKENKAHKRAVVGTGLGLSIVKNILQMHNAPFGIETSTGPLTHGSTFWFELKTTQYKSFNIWRS